MNTLALEALKAMQSEAAARNCGLRICDEAIAALEAEAAQPVTVEAAIAQLVEALCQSKGWLHGYADAKVRDALEAAQEPTDDEILALAHRTATTYAHRSDPKYHSYGFVPHTLIAFARALLEPPRSAP